MNMWFFNDHNRSWDLWNGKSLHVTYCFFLIRLPSVCPVSIIICKPSFLMNYLFTLTHFLKTSSLVTCPLHEFLHICRYRHINFAAYNPVIYKENLKRILLYKYYVFCQSPVTFGVAYLWITCNILIIRDGYVICQKLWEF